MVLNLLVQGSGWVGWWETNQPQEGGGKARNWWVGGWVGLSPCRKARHPFDVHSNEGGGGAMGSLDHGCDILACDAIYLDAHCHTPSKYMCDKMVVVIVMSSSMKPRHSEQNTSNLVAS